MPILPRATVQSLSDWPKLPGNRLEKIRLDAGEHTEGFAEFLPFNLPPELVATYPSYYELVDKLAAAWNVEPDQILLTNGSDEGLELIAETFVEPNVTRAICNAPSFIVIPRSLQRTGALLVQIPVRLNDLSPDEQKIEAELGAERVHLAVFASPDNPTGMMVSPDTVARFCQKFPDTLFVIDEAYFEFTNTTSLPLIHRFGNLIVSRTFSKAWGLAGLRIGALIGNRDVLKYVRRVATIYNVNCIAAAAALSMLPHQEKVVAAAQATIGRKNTLVEALRTNGFDTHLGHANFFLLNMGEHAVEFAKHCEANDVLIRVCAPQATPAQAMYGRLRISIGTEQECKRFLEVAIAFGMHLSSHQA